MEHSNFEDLSIKRVHGKILFEEIFDLILKRLSTQDCFSHRKWYGMQISKTDIPIKTTISTLFIQQDKYQLSRRGTLDGSKKIQHCLQSKAISKTSKMVIKIFTKVLEKNIRVNTLSAISSSG